MLSRKPKILYLWSEVTGYVLSTIDVLQNKFDADVNLVYWDEKNINSVLFKFENKKIRVFVFLFAISCCFSTLVMGRCSVTGG